jgi:hypothetical protein
MKIYPWDYPITVCLIIQNEKKIDSIVNELRLQSDNPYIAIVYNGSNVDYIKYIYDFKSPDVEIHFAEINSINSVMNLCCNLLYSKYICFIDEDFLLNSRDMLAKMSFECSKHEIIRLGSGGGFSGTMVSSSLLDTSDTRCFTEWINEKNPVKVDIAKNHQKLIPYNEPINIYTVGAGNYKDMEHSVFLNSLKITNDPNIRVGAISVEVPGNANWNSYGYMSTIIKRTKIALNLIKNNYGKIVIFSDSDILWIRPFYDIVQKLMINKDVLFMKETDHCDYYCVNGGLAVVRCSEITEKLYADVLDRVEQNPEHDDQYYISELFKVSAKYPIRWARLPNTFSNTAIIKDKFSLICYHTTGTYPSENKTSMEKKYEQFTDFKEYYVVNESLDGIEIVVAKYKEDIDWLHDLNCKKKVYDKSESKLTPAIALPNIGREAHTYFHHIIENYDNLSDVTIFCQGNTMAHCRKFMSNIIKIPRNISFINLCDVNLDCYLNGRPNHDGLKIQELLSTMFPDDKLPDTLCFGAGAIMAIGRDTIRQYTKEQYQKWLDLSINFPEAPWCFERIYEWMYTRKVI